MFFYSVYKEYKLPNGRTVTADFNELGCATITIQAMDALFDILNSSEQQWISCSERLPRTNGVYNVTRKISDGFECRNISDACYYDGANTWHDDTRVNHERMYLTDVIAWMPLPEPYKGEES